MKRTVFYHLIIWFAVFCCLILVKFNLKGPSKRLGVSTTSPSPSPKIIVPDRRAVSAVPLIQEASDFNEGLIKKFNPTIYDERQEFRVQPFHKSVGNVQKTPDGYVLTYQFYQGRVPILNSKVIIYLDQKQEWLRQENSYQSIDKVDLKPQVSRNEVMRALETKYRIESVSEGMVILPNAGEGRLAYSLSVTEKSSNEPASLLVDAHSKQVLLKAILRR